ncbi:MAG: PaaI family thioesterase [Fulvivirga sp.]
MTKMTKVDFKARIDKFLERQHFMKHIGFDLNVIEEGRTEGWLDIEQRHHQQKGFVHGGVIATVADIVAGFAAYTKVPEDHHVVTGELKVSYFNPGIGDRLHAIGYVVKSGRKINFCEAEVWCHNGDSKKLIAKASTSMITVFPEDVKR